jgi:hypothetical protein
VLTSCCRSRNSGVCEKWGGNGTVGGGLNTIVADQPCFLASWLCLIPTVCPFAPKACGDARLHFYGP